jgi:hypothetical protein
MVFEILLYVVLSAAVFAGAFALALQGLRSRRSLAPSCYMFFHRGNAKFAVLQGERDFDLFKSFSVKKNSRVRCRRS